MNRLYVPSPVRDDRNNRSGNEVFRRICTKQGTLPGNMDCGKGKGKDKMDEFKKIPHGISSCGTIRRDNCYYVDKNG